MMFRGVLFERLGRSGSRVESSFAVPWTEDGVLGVFGHQPAIDKSAQQLWAAAEYLAGSTRGNAGLNAVFAAVLDCDCGDVGTMDATIAYLRNQGRAIVAYSSWSHGDSAKLHGDSGRTGPFDAFRIVLPYDRPVTPAEHRALVPALFGHELPLDPAHYAAEVLGRFVETASHPRAARPRGWDPASSRPSQAYYVPSARSSVDVYEGAPVSVDAVFARPTTARPSMRAQRPYARPDGRAVGALRRILVLLHEPSAAGFEGWHRAPCPACAPDGMQRSPSFRARASGDGIDVHCFAGCSRPEIFRALGLSPTGAYRAPTHLRAALDEQLLAQAPGVAIDVDAAAVRLTDDIREALADRVGSVIRYPAGTGKSVASAVVLTERARAGYRIVYSTQEHAVASETRTLLPADVRARSVHIHSPIVRVAGDAVCVRAGEISSRVFEFGVSLLGQICPRCVYRTTCPALAEARDRAAKLPDASVIFVSHAGIGQVFGLDAMGTPKGAGLELIVDEMPAPYTSVTCTRAQLEGILHTPTPSAQPTVALAAREIARAWLAGTAPGEVRWANGSPSLGGAVDIARKWKRLVLVENATPTPEERPVLVAADAVIRIAAADPKDVMGLHTGEDIVAMLSDAAHEALVARAGVLLSATPMMAALPGFRLREAAVHDGARVTRKMVLSPARGSAALTRAAYASSTRSRRVGAEAGTPWAVVDTAIARALAEAEQYACKRVLFVTFKAVADALRARGMPNVSVAHFGALRGKNDWMEGRPGECSVAYLLGTPRFAIMPTLRKLGLVGEAADQAWVAYAAAELEQAEGRLRLPRRRTPCTVMVEGDVAPSSWHTDNVDEVIEPTQPTSALERALWWHGVDGVADAAGVGAGEVFRWLSTGDGPTDILERLSALSIGEAMGLLADMPIGAREADFTWALDD